MIYIYIYIYISNSYHIETVNYSTILNYFGTTCKFCANYCQFLHNSSIWTIILCCLSNEILRKWCNV